MTPTRPVSTRPLHSRLLACASAAVAASLTLVAPQQALASDDIVVPSMPASLQVPAGNEVYLVQHAVGTQNYVCLPSGGGYVWSFWGPQATLFGDDDDQKLTHFLSADSGGIARPTWMHSKDSSTIWGAGIATASSVSNPEFVEAGAIPWLLVAVVDSHDGPTGGDKLSDTTFIQRLDTSGGVAPAAAGCAAATDVGKRALVPYTTDYYFYRSE
jgi:hypothetical protein